MKFIILNGSSCVGKSTIVKNIMQRRARLFHLSYDAVKRAFSQYSRNEQFEDVHAAMFALAETMFTLKYDVICDSILFREWRGTLANLALSHDYTVVEINLEADYKVLVERFNNRLARAAENPDMKLYNLSKDRLRELYDIYETEKNPEAVILRTDEHTIEEITESVTQYL